MKEYTAAVIPLIVCTIISVLIAIFEPKDHPDPAYTYRTENAINYVSAIWILVGFEEGRNPIGQP